MSRMRVPIRESQSKRAPRKRVPLGAGPGRLSFEFRLRVWLASTIALFILLLSFGLHAAGYSAAVLAGSDGIALVVLWILALRLLDHIVRPLQTLTNIVVALREDDFSLRARGAQRSDAVGDLAIEINALAESLQREKANARDAVTLAERMMSSMHSPVLAFDHDNRPRLMNAAAEQLFGVDRNTMDRIATGLDLDPLLRLPDGGIYITTARHGSNERMHRWSVRRTGFRMDGLPYTLLLLADIDIALREEERTAWQRLIRVLGHEINNSLTPIVSIAATLRSRLTAGDSTAKQPGHSAEDLARGLSVIEERASSLNRFLQAYQQLSRLPAPTAHTIALQPLLERVARLETRLQVRVHEGPTTRIPGDPDQLEQLLINLIRNAAEAALSTTDEQEDANVEISHACSTDEAIIVIQDNGPGLANPGNLFVPFYTTKPEGSGIGLVLAQQIARAHNGTVALVNRIDGVGCRAEVRLPRTQHR